MKIPCSENSEKVLVKIENSFVSSTDQAFVNLLLIALKGKSNFAQHQRNVSNFEVNKLNVHALF